LSRACRSRLREDIRQTDDPSHKIDAGIVREYGRDRGEDRMKRVLTLASLILLETACSNSGDFSWVTHTWTTDHGVYAMDHISRRKIDVTQAVRRNYMGETYYFESDENARKFDSNPWAYLYNDNVHLQGHPDRSDQN
jgi:YHS domain-containing protein